MAAPSVTTSSALSQVELYTLLVALRGLDGSATFNPASLIDAAGEETTITVTGAALGDFVLASFSLDTDGLTVTAWVSAADTVTVRLQNESGGTLDIASGTLRVRVLPR